MTDDKPWFAPDHQPAGTPGQRRPGPGISRLRDGRRRIQSCEMRDATSVGAGWDVLMLVDGEPHFSRRSPDIENARWLANPWEQVNLRGGQQEPEE